MERIPDGRICVYCGTRDDRPFVVERIAVFSPRKCHIPIYKHIHCIERLERR